MNLRLLLLSLFFINTFSAFSVNPPKYEFRGVWVATVNNIDWPSKPGLSEKDQKREAIELLDLLKENGMNAVVFQVRPTSDAFYKSELEPWSMYLTGTQGGDPGYDPLEFWVEQCHERNMELHAWLNPFRIAQSAKDPLSVEHIAFKHPDWVVPYNGKLYFNPGIPEVREFVVKVVEDIVSRYDVDAIHFDDYFYPYPAAGEVFRDYDAFVNYNNGFSSGQIDDWRRDNVNQTIQMLSEDIKLIKPWVKFGISPFGVWRNKSDDPRGSNTTAGTSSYRDLYADVLTWLENGWIDYVAPQIYWEIGHSSADYKELCNWWSENRHNSALYIGHALYKSNSQSTVEEWRKADQLPKQVELTREIEGIDGSIFYSAKHFKRDLMGFQNALKTQFYTTYAIVPPIAMLDSTGPVVPYRLRKSGRKLKWKVEEVDDPMSEAISYVIYRNSIEEILNPELASSIYLVTRDMKTRISKDEEESGEYEFRVSALDRFNNESKLTDPVILKF